MIMSLVKISRSREAELEEEVALLQQEKQELQYNICLLEVDNQTLRDEIQRPRGETGRAVTRVHVEWEEASLGGDRNVGLKVISL